MIQHRRDHTRPAVAGGGRRRRRGRHAAHRLRGRASRSPTSNSPPSPTSPSVSTCRSLRIPAQLVDAVLADDPDARRPAPARRRRRLGDSDHRPAARPVVGHGGRASRTSSCAACATVRQRSSMPSRSAATQRSAWLYDVAVTPAGARHSATSACSCSSCRSGPTTRSTAACAAVHRRDAAAGHRAAQRLVGGRRRDRSGDVARRSGSFGRDRR